MSSYVMIAVLLSGPSASPEALPGYGGSLLRMLAALVIVSVLAYLVLRYGLRRLSGKGGRSQRMEVIDRCALGGSKALWIVRVGRRTFLVGAAEQGLNLVAELNEGDLQDASVSPSRATSLPSRFAEILRGARGDDRVDGGMGARAKRGGGVSTERDGGANAKKLARTEVATHDADREGGA